MLKFSLMTLAMAVLPLAACSHDRSVVEAERALAEARAEADESAIVGFYDPDAVIRRDYQPVFCGVQLEQYLDALGRRGEEKSYEFAITETFDFDDGTLTFGTFIAKGTHAGGAPFEEVGRFARLWGADADGVPRVIAEVIGHPAALDAPERYRLDGLAYECAPGVSDPALARQLADQNSAMATAVDTRDIEYRIGVFADDGAFLPFAHPDVVGKEALTPYLTDYIEAGRGLTFDSVRVWADGAFDYGGHVVELSSFEVTWGADADAGIVSGGSLRLWRRAEDGALLLLREIATHD